MAGSRSVRELDRRARDKFSNTHRPNPAWDFRVSKRIGLMGVDVVLCCVGGVLLYVFCGVRGGEEAHVFENE